MVLDVCPKLTNDKKNISRAIKFQIFGQKDVKMNLIMKKINFFLE